MSFIMYFSCSCFRSGNCLIGPFAQMSRRTASPGGGSNHADSEGDRKRVKKQFQSKQLNVLINYATKIPMQAIVNAIRGQDSEHFQEAVRVLDIVLRQNAAKQ